MSRAANFRTGAPADPPDWLTTPIEFEDQSTFRACRNIMALRGGAGCRRAALGGAGANSRAFDCARPAHAGVAGTPRTASRRRHRRPDPGRAWTGRGEGSATDAPARGDGRGRAGSTQRALPQPVAPEGAAGGSDHRPPGELRALSATPARPWSPSTSKPISCASSTA